MFLLQISPPKTIDFFLQNEVVSNVPDIPNEVKCHMKLHSPTISLAFFVDIYHLKESKI